MNHRDCMLQCYPTSGPVSVIGLNVGVDLGVSVDGFLVASNSMLYQQGVQVL